MYNDITNTATCEQRTRVTATNISVETQRA